jgi:pimeloyl-ACP methyl ester carboxylesterase
MLRGVALPILCGHMRWNFLFAFVAVTCIGFAVWHLHAASAGVVVRSVEIGATPATIYRPAAPPAGPVVVIAHGFAGSQQLMQTFALTLARNGYTAVTFDFPGHGRNPAPLMGSITDTNGATRALTDELARVARYARPLGDGRLAVLGHSMASDIVVRFAEATPDVGATIAVSMFSPAVTATAPANLLVIVGDWEGMLKKEALRAESLATAPAAARPGVTYGDPAKGVARRVAFSPHVEHASVLFSETSMREAVAWLDSSFGIARSGPPLVQARGPWILLLIAGVVLLARPLAAMLPAVAHVPMGAGLGWRKLWMPMLVPMILTPLLLRVLPTHFLPVLVGDYLAAHFAVYGVITALCLAWSQRHLRALARTPIVPSGLFKATLAVIMFGFIALVWPIDRYVTAFFPGPERVLLVLAMLVGTLAFFLGDEWLTRGAGAARGAYVASKFAFLMSLAIAVALDLERLFFLIIIVPVIALFFIVYGLFSHWVYRGTRHPFVAAIANGVAFAWAIGVTFPLLAG